MHGGSGAGGKPARNRKIYVRLNRLLSVLLAVIVVLSATALPAMADETKDSDASFYKMSSVASSYLSDQLAKGSSGSGVNLPFSLSQSSAGGLLGYSDEADQHGIVMKWFMSALSNSSASFSYSSLAGVTADDGTGNPLYVYCKYGQLLNMVGFDNTGTDSSLTIGRFLGGGIILGAYWLSNIVPNLFKGMIGILKILNPFRFVNSNRALADASAVGMYATDGGATNSPTAANSVFGTIAVFLTKVYNTLYDNFVPVIIAFLFIVMVSRLLFSNINGKSGKNWIRVKNFIFRSVMMILGVPLIGMLYTDCLDALSGDMEAGYIPANTIVMSTFLDFETWAHELRLAIPVEGVAKLGLNNVRATVDSYTYANLRSTCYNINAASFNSLISHRIAAAGNPIANSWESATFPTQSVGGSVTVNGMAEDMASWNTSVRSGSDGISGSAKTASELVYDMLQRYMSGTFYYAGSYESDVKGDWRYEDVKSTVEAATGTVKDFEKLADSFDTDKLFGSGGGADSGAGLLANFARVDDSTRYLAYDHPDSLSVMAMYNYLNSKFDAANVVVYSSEKASSGLVRESHYSVNLIGGNAILSFLYWLNAVLMLVALVVLGGFYAFSMVFSAFKRLFHAVPAMFGTVVGSLQMAAKLLVIAVTAIFEVVGTMVMYVMASDLLLSIDRIVTIPIVALSSMNSFEWGTTKGNLTDVFNGAGSALNVTLTLGMVCVMLIVSAVLYVLFMLTAMRARKGFVSYMDKAASSFIESLFGVRVDQTPDSPGAMSRLGQGVMGGIGAGAMARMAMGDSGDSRSAAGEASDAGEEKEGNGNGGGGPDGNDETRDGKAGDANDGGENDSGDASENEGNGSGFDEEDAEDDADRQTASSLAEADSLSGTSSASETSAESGGNPDGTPKDEKKNGGQKDLKATDDKNSDKNANANKERSGEERGEANGDKAQKGLAAGDNNKTETKSGSDDKSSTDKPATDAPGERRDLKPGDPGYTGGNPDSQHDDSGFIRDDDDDASNNSEDKTNTPETPAETSGQPKSPLQQRVLKPGDKAPGGRRGNRSGNDSTNHNDRDGGLTGSGNQSDEQAAQLGADGKPLVPGDASTPKQSGENGNAAVNSTAESGSSNQELGPDGKPVDQPRPVAPAESNGGPNPNAGPGKTSKLDGTQATDGSVNPVEASEESAEETPKPVETAEEQQPAPASGTPETPASGTGNNSSGTRRTLSPTPHGNGNQNGNQGTGGTGIGGGNLGSNEQSNTHTPNVTPTDPKAPGVPMESGTRLSPVQGVDPHAHGIEAVTETPVTDGTPAPAPGPSPAAEPVPVTAGNTPSGQNGESRTGGGSDTVEPQTEQPPEQPRQTRPGQSSQSRRQPSTSNTVRPGQTQRVTGSIDGHAAEGTAVLNEDGSTTVSMHRTDSSPSLSVTKEEAGIISAGLESGPGAGGKGQLTEAQKIARMAAAAAFMSGSKNEFVKNMGQAMQYGVASQLTDEILHGRQTQIPKYGPGSRKRPMPGMPAGGGHPNPSSSPAPEEGQPRDILDGTPEEQAEADARTAELARRNKAAQEEARKKRDAERRRRREAKRTKTVKYDDKDPNQRGKTENGSDNGPAGTRK